MNHILLTYRNLKELRKIQKEREVSVFLFGETMDMLNSRSDVCIDITGLIHFLLVNKNNIEPTYINFANMTEDTVVIAEETVAASAIELLPLLFSGYKFYFGENEREEHASEEVYEYKPYPRHKVYTYANAESLEIIIKYAEDCDIPIATFSQANGELHNSFEQFNKAAELALLDLTSVAYAIEDNKALIYALEQFLHCMPNISVIARTTQVDLLLKYFPLFFEGQDPIYKLIPDLQYLKGKESEENKIVRITDLSKDDLDTLINTFNHNLIGHINFKNKLQHALKNYIALNRAKEQKVISIFLFGASGIGKTEVARLIANGLIRDSYLAKINFQNYSSQDSLNSLIGSPAGYVGCNHGELSEKIQKSKVGVLLCDEFEKTTRPVFPFFLELLEEGRFTDSMAREYDLDGYIIIFTSKLLTEEDYKKAIPPELQTRFDLVCEFEEPTIAEKTAFLDLLLEKAKAKYSEEFEKAKMTEDEKTELYDFDYSSLSALRDIKRVFNNRLMDYFSGKGVL